MVYKHYLPGSLYSKSQLWESHTRDCKVSMIQFAVSIIYGFILYCHIILKQTCNISKVIKRKVIIRVILIVKYVILFAEIGIANIFYCNSEWKVKLFAQKYVLFSISLFLKMPGRLVNNKTEIHWKYLFSEFLSIKSIYVTQIRIYCISK